MYKLLPDARIKFDEFAKYVASLIAAVLTVNEPLILTEPVYDVRIKVEPDVPLVPEVPLVPLLPLTPDVPDVPLVPEVPLLPLTPDVPLVPLVP